ncbi:MAG: hypothetical protein L0Y72_25535, partial [Gemmataceae bacterium]|nr:hypothetical protein [Gemmataceae bacterium]
CTSCSSNSERMEKIPLSSIYASNGQENLKQIGFTDDLPFQDTIESFQKLKPGVSNLFLARARDVNGAFEAALSFQVWPPSVGRKEGEQAQVWLIAYFGRAPSDPTRWIIESVEYNQAKIVLNFSEVAKIGIRSADSRPYFVLVPLKTVPQGKCQLELRNAGTGAVTLARIVDMTSDTK